ncbi:MAG: PIN domain nuclease [Verrucomicrobia bacterium]|nr:PIN domain nuclease [Verrucomicrobiota bacterium]
MVLVDTSFWIDFLSGRNNWASNCLKQKLASREAVAYIDLILLEIVQGLRNSFDRSKIEAAFGKLIILPQNRSSIMFAADIYKGLQRNGIQIRSITDCLIAAIAMEFGATVLHRDRDFSYIADHYPLEIETE